MCYYFRQILQPILDQYNKKTEIITNDEEVI